MPCFRFFSDEPLLHHRVILKDEENHHLQHVMRVQEQEDVELIDGKGTLAKASVIKLSKQETTLEILSKTESSPPSSSLSLVLPILRQSHLDFAIEKATEVGIDHFILFSSDKGERKDLPPSLLRRLTSITISAIKQSGRLFLPTISFQKSLSFLKGKPYLWADLHPKAKSLQETLHEIIPPEQLYLCVGPESGWSEGEKDFLIQGSTPVTLHKNILRAETAAVVFSYSVSNWVN